MRRIVVLESAAEDIERGREFYDQQEIGLGAYFEDTILSDIESLGLFHGIHSIHFGFHQLGGQELILDFLERSGRSKEI